MSIAKNKSKMRTFKTIEKAILFAIKSKVDYDIAELEKQLKKHAICKMNNFIFVVDEQGILDDKKEGERL